MCSFKFLLIFLILPALIASKRGMRNRVDVTANRITSSNKRSSSMRCPSKCKCDSNKKEVNCSYKSLSFVPKSKCCFQICCGRHSDVIFLQRIAVKNLCKNSTYFEIGPYHGALSYPESYQNFECSTQVKYLP